jgi:alpha-tubulin suppressor-like RCC1 family protein
MTRWIGVAAIRGVTITLSVAGTVLGGISCSGDDLTAPTDPPVPAESGPAFTVGAASELLFGQVAAGYYHSCGLTIDGRAYCWGWNALGQLGDGTTTSPHERPTAVSTGLHFREVSAGFHHTCGLTTDDRIYCWGNNDDGELGDGTTTQRLKPVPVADGRHFRQVRAGFHHTCGLTLDKRAYCWGRNTSGELGTGRGSALRPAAVAGGLRFFQLTAGNSFSCGKTTDYRGFCWGSNDNGQLGDGTTTSRPTPRAVTGGLQFYQVSAGGSHTCGLTPANTVYCWGSNAGGALGDGINYFRRLTPVKVVGGLYFRQVVAGQIYSCGLTRDSRAYCWGYNGSGQGGDGTTITERWTPVAVAGGLRFNAAIGVTAGGHHTCGLSTDQRVYCWGSNNNGDLGDGTTRQRLMPVPVAAAVQ